VGASVTSIETSTGVRPLRLVAVMPVYNDWEVADIVCRELDARFAGQAHIDLQVLLVDDGSSSGRPPELCAGAFAAVRAVHLLRLRRNVGHQRAIGIGLAWIHEQVAAEAVLVMDSDGQDRPADVPTLLQAFEQHERRAAVFAARQKRPESTLFRVSYALYRGVHRVLTGFSVRIGNFSVIPMTHVARLLVSSDLWSHYAAAVVRSRVPLVTIPIDRGERIQGRSTMDFVALVAHGLSAISVFRERVGTRLLVGAVAGAGLLAAFLIAGVALAIVSQPAVPTWLWIVACSAALMTFQAVAALFVLAFIIMSQRDLLGFLPIRDYVHFVDDCQRLC
jgi:polyisoprenyl-phosphate glycosyltransferase